MSVITAITMTHDPLLATNELELVSSGGSSTVKTPFVNLDLTSRSKIVIRPRCKEYALKQRTARRTLACFTSVNSHVEHTETEWQNSFTKERSEEGTKEGPSSPKNSKVAEGRVDKPTKASLPRVTQNLPPPAPVPTPTSSTYAEEIAKCGCTTNGSEECKRCRILRLADRFCSVVTAQCEKWNLESSQSGRGNPF